MNYSDDDEGECGRSIWRGLQQRLFPPRRADGAQRELVWTRNGPA